MNKCPKKVVGVANRQSGREEVVVDEDALIRDSEIGTIIDEDRAQRVMGGVGGSGGVKEKDVEEIKKIEQSSPGPGSSVE